MLSSAKLETTLDLMRHFDLNPDGWQLDVLKSEQPRLLLNQMVLDFIKTEPDGAVANAMRKAIDGTPDLAIIPSPFVVPESTETGSSSTVYRAAKN